MPYDERQLEAHRAVMTRGDEIPVTLVTYDEQRTAGVIRLLRLTPEERRKRAGKWLLIFLILAPLSVVCPPHIPWPFVMVTVGVVGFYLRRRRSEIVLGGEAKCPKCGAFQILPAGNAEFPMAHFCTECGERSLLAPEARAAA